MDSEYKGYVLVTRVGDSYEYKISLTDGTFGIREKNIDELKKLDVLPYYKVNNPMVDSECK